MRHIENARSDIVILPNMMMPFWLGRLGTPFFLLCVVILLFISEISFRLFGFTVKDFLSESFVQCFFSSSVSLLFAFIHHVPDAHSVFHLPATAVCCEKLSLAIMLNKTKILKYTCNKFSVKSKLVCSKPCTIHAANSNVGSYKNLIEWWRNFFTIAHLVRCSKRDREHEMEEEGKKTLKQKVGVHIPSNWKSSVNKYYNQIWQMAAIAPASVPTSSDESAPKMNTEPHNMS